MKTLDKKIMDDAVNLYLSCYKKSNAGNYSDFREHYFSVAKDNGDMRMLFHSVLMCDVEDVERVFNFCRECVGKNLDIEQKRNLYVKTVFSPYGLELAD